METQAQQKIDVFQIVTNRIIAHLENGVVPWQQPWANSGIPQNLVTKRHYRGLNVWLLNGFARNLFLTFKQAKELGCSVKKGEKALPVIFWNWKEIQDDETGEKRRVAFLRYYNVFNVEQVEGIEEHLPEGLQEKTLDPIAACEEILERMSVKPIIRHKEQKAYYNALKDFINMPRIGSFTSNVSYYSTLWHEIAHWTGAPGRLNRAELVQMSEFGSDPYSKEELTAEMTAAYLMSHCGHGETVENSASYIDGWLKALQNDRRLLVYAAAKAQQSVDFILNVTFAEAEPQEPSAENQASNESSDDLPF